MAGAEEQGFELGRERTFPIAGEGALTGWILVGNESHLDLCDRLEARRCVRTAQGDFTQFVILDISDEPTPDFELY